MSTLGRYALVVLLGAFAAAVLTSWIGVGFRIAALLIVVGLAITVAAVIRGERSGWLLLPALLLGITAVVFVVVDAAGGTH